MKIKNLLLAGLLSAASVFGGESCRDESILSQIPTLVHGTRMAWVVTKFDNIYITYLAEWGHLELGSKTRICQEGGIQKLSDGGLTIDVKIFETGRSSYLVSSMLSATEVK